MAVAELAVAEASGAAAFEQLLSVAMQLPQNVQLLCKKGKRSFH